MKKTTITEMNRMTVDQFRHAEKMPLIVVLDDVRSLYNVGSIFRTADAFRVEEIWLCGITATPDDVCDAQGNILRPCSLKASQEIHKTALGAEESVAWRYFPTALEAVAALKNRDYMALAVEQCHGSVMLGDFTLSPAGGADTSSSVQENLSGTTDCHGYGVILGNEVKGVHQEVIDQCRGCLEIPQYGTKHSLNVSVTGGIIIWHFANLLIH